MNSVWKKFGNFTIGRSKRAGKSVETKLRTPSESSESGEDDEIGELPELDATSYQTRKQRHSVSAEVYGEWNKRSDFVPPVYSKTEDQKTRIKIAVAKGFMFSNLEQGDLNTVIDAFVEKKVPTGETIITQGDDAECLYLIEKGEFDVYKLLAGENVPRHMCVMSVGDAVGELALLYSCPRAATVTAKNDAVLWSLDRQSFNHIVKDAAFRRRQRHEDFLSEVELLKDMDPYERSKLADALKISHHKSGDDVVREGESGDTFYIIETGEAEAVKQGVVVLNYKRGDYFGELALIRNAPRAATVRAKTDMQCVFLDRRSFQRLLGPVESILQRNAARYRKMQTMFVDPDVPPKAEPQTVIATDSGKAN